MTSYGSYVTNTSSFGVISRSESTVTSAQHLKPFSDVPGPRGLPLIGTLWDFAKPNGFGFNKMFEVIDISCECFTRYADDVTGKEIMLKSITRNHVRLPSFLYKILVQVSWVCFIGFSLRRTDPSLSGSFLPPQGLIPPTFVQLTLCFLSLLIIP